MTASPLSTSPETPQRILDAAERLFIERGVTATSLRAITTAAGVNLAAVNYHFGSKRGLFEAVIARKVAPANQERLKRLEQLEAGSRAPGVEAILDAFLRPVFERPFHSEGPHVSALLFSEPAEVQAPLIAEVFGEVSLRFCQAMGRALPHLDPSEVMERFKFVVGVMVHQLSGHADVQVVPGMSPPASAERRLEGVLAFCAAGLRAPAIADRSREEAEAEMAR